MDLLESSTGKVLCNVGPSLVVLMFSNRWWGLNCAGRIILPLRYQWALPSIKVLRTSVCIWFTTVPQGHGAKPCPSCNSGPKQLASHRRRRHSNLWQRRFKELLGPQEAVESSLELDAKPNAERGTDQSFEGSGKPKTRTAQSCNYIH